MTSPLLRRVSPSRLPARAKPGLDAQTVHAAKVVVEAVRKQGESALLRYAKSFGDLTPGQTWLYGSESLQNAWRNLEPQAKQALQRTADRIRDFAEAQKQALRHTLVQIPGGLAGDAWIPVDRAGAYAPGGRHPLPSSVLMTVIPAAVAGVSQVVVASPRPGQVTLAAAAVAGAHQLLAVGGAQAIAALGLGVESLGACEIVVGPGNRWVTAAKKLLAGEIAIDGLAGPSELVVVADEKSNPDLVAADLLAQAEHDPDALPILICLDEASWQGVESALQTQLGSLPNDDDNSPGAVAAQALQNGYVVVVDSPVAAVKVCNALAPEHLQLSVAEPEAWIPHLRHAGALFLGEQAGEVCGDYGFGPNHVLPTGGTARFQGGLHPGVFLRRRTWMRVDDPDAADQAFADAALLARLEGLEAHARAADLRRRRI
ncbi:MAG: histidinol dehydrogenase [Planctomycetota bacterium]|nr:MAG: histidinol dehydrogenase [Planctomycetota bacterium]